MPAGRGAGLTDRLHLPWRRSLTAGVNAHFRMRETLRSDRILDDPWAAILADDHLAIRALALLERLLPAALVAAGWAPGEPTVFVVEGLVHYLPRSLVASLLSAMSVGGPRRVVLSWIDPAMSNRVHATFRESMRLLGEVPRAFFTAAELAQMFAASGLGDFRSWDYAAQVRAFAPGAASRRVGLTQEVGIAGGHPPSQIQDHSRFSRSRRRW